MSSVLSEVKATLVVFSPVLGRFLVKNPISDAAMLHARSVIGDIEWKKGFTPDKSMQIAQMLSKAGIHHIVITGLLKRVYYDETKDSQGNTYPKVRIILEDPFETIMISLEATSEIASIALQLLYNAQPGEELTITAFHEVANRGGRTFYNHRVRMTRVDGSHVPPIVGAWKKAQDAADAATLQFKEMMDLPGIKTVVNKIASGAKMKFHLDLLHNDIAPRFK